MKNTETANIYSEITNNTKFNPALIEEAEDRYNFIDRVKRIGHTGPEKVIIGYAKKIPESLSEEDILSLKETTKYYEEALEFDQSINSNKNSHLITPVIEFVKRYQKVIA